MRALIPLVCIASGSSHAAELNIGKTDDGTKTIIKLSGQITAGDADKLGALLGKYESAGKPVAGLWLNSPGGSLVEGLKLANLVHKIGMPTVVAHDTLCASACFLPFAAGVSKYASRNARIGVHSAVDGRNGQEDNMSMTATVLMVRAATSFGVPAAITIEMVNTVPKKISWLSEDELLGMGVVMSGGGARNSSPSPWTPDLNYNPNLTMPSAPAAKLHMAASPAPLSQPTRIHDSQPAAERAALLVDAPDEPTKIKTYVGTVVWRAENVSPGQNQPLAQAVRAEIDVPEASLKLTMLFQKDFEQRFPASHTLNLRFALGQDSPVGSFKQISVPQMRKDDSPSGDALVGLPVTITSNYFLVGLSRGDVTLRNLELIKTRNWFDIPLLLTKGKVAKITFEKGASGQQIIDSVLRGWEDPAGLAAPDGQTVRIGLHSDTPTSGAAE